MKSIFEYVERSYKRFPDKTAFVDADASITYSELYNYSRSIATAVGRLGTRNCPVAIYIDKSVKVPSAMFGIACSNNFYIVVDTEMPKERVEKIFETLSPVAIVTDEAHLEKARELGVESVIIYEDAISKPADDELLAKIYDRMIDTDPLYALFTSGSTGMPKGAIINHRNVLSYSAWFVKAFDITEDTVFGNQTPFYFSMSVSDVFATINAGATLCIVPKVYFAFPIKLIGFLNEQKINTIYWVPSAISIVANMQLFKYAKPEYLKKVLFAGEVMPTKQLNYWIENLPEDTMFANLYGPTETTDICTYYVVDRKFENGESLPIGKHCDNCDVMIVKEDNTLAKVGEEGELYVRGSFLFLGYYNNEEKTSAALVQNPLHNYYPELVYKTGDLVKENERGEILYITRKDFQIKRMGYRVELGEIEAAASGIDKIEESVCVFDKKKDQIILVYQAKKLDEVEIINALKGKIPAYMMPDRYEKVKLMPHNQNGKIDRKLLENDLCEK
ncbi:MAG: AMP-binding protein [Eubacterium sp.]|nr:AMP-binding protein [Eubacterium sp.]